MVLACRLGQGHSEASAGSMEFLSVAPGFRSHSNSSRRQNAAIPDFQKPNCRARFRAKYALQIVASPNVPKLPRCWLQQRLI